MQPLETIFGLEGEGSFDAFTLSVSMANTDSHLPYKIRTRFWRVEDTERLLDARAARYRADTEAWARMLASAQS